MTILPKPYPDELIGSVIERACYQTGIPMKRLIQALFGTSRSSVSFLMGSKLQKLERYVGLDANELLAKHTMFPYSVAYMSAKEQTRLRLKTLNLTSDECIGSLTKNISHGVSHRRVCSICIEGDIRLYGETYWRRSHQLPGVLTCAVHHFPLWQTTIKLRNTVQSEISTIPNAAVVAQPVLTVDANMAATLLKISTDALSSRIEPRDNWSLIYNTMAKKSGYAIAGERIATRHLSDDLFNFFGAKMLEGAGCASHTISRTAWPGLMVRPSVPPNFASAKHVFIDAFFKLSPGALSELHYIAPGKKVRDYQRCDREAAKKIAAFRRAHGSSSARYTVQELLTHAGVYQSFRHNREKYPLVREQINIFRTSNQSARQIGLRPYWRKRLQSRNPSSEK